MEKEIEKVKDLGRIRALIRLGQSINMTRWKLGLDPEAQEVFRKFGIKKEDIGSRLKD